MKEVANLYQILLTENLTPNIHRLRIMAPDVAKKARAGGDIVTGAATVISAMGAGKQAAASIDAYLEESAVKPSGVLLRTSRE